MNVPLILCRVLILTVIILMEAFHVESAIQALTEQY